MKVKKEITFVYLDEVERQVYEMIAREAEKRGYKTTITDNKFAKCEIGWYCEHINFSQFSKFSIVMLHDITQQYGNWPDIWLREPWNKYDIGFLPSKVWEDNWNQCSQYYYTNPRKGLFLTGWPKADRLLTYMDESKKAELQKKTGLDSLKPTILYAPSWENDGKQDEFVKSMLPLDVNILIKQAPWPDTYPEQLKNIAEMRELHSKNPRVIQMDPKTNILDAIMISDILVSEESSTMCESVMLGKPAISVSNWLIPDVIPSRYPSDNYDFVIKTTKEKLTQCVSHILANYNEYADQAQNYSDSHFSNLGKCIPMMLDIIDAFIEDKPLPYKPLVPKRREKVPFSRLCFHMKEVIKREVYYNYCARSTLMANIWKIARQTKRFIVKK